MSSSGQPPVPDISDSVMEMFSMKGKVASVTGASSGIGLAVAQGLAEAGADVAIVRKPGGEKAFLAGMIHAL